MVQKFDMPTLTTDEKALLQAAADPLARAKTVLDRLEAIGVDVTDHRAQLDQVEQLRSGLLQQFGANRPRRA